MRKIFTFICIIIITMSFLFTACGEPEYDKYAEQTMAEQLLVPQLSGDSFSLKKYLSEHGFTNIHPRRKTFGDDWKYFITGYYKDDICELGVGGNLIYIRFANNGKEESYVYEVTPDQITTRRCNINGDGSEHYCNQETIFLLSFIIINLEEDPNNSDFTRDLPDGYEEIIKVIDHTIS